MTFGIRRPKDFWAGAIYVAVGAAAVHVAGDYAMGSATRMGPAYFPTVLGSLLAAVGAASLLRSFIAAARGSDRVTGLALKPLALVLMSVVAFGLLARGAGLVAALFVLIMISAGASAMFRWKASALLAAGMILFSALVFIKGLGVPLPLVGPWLQG